MLSVHLRTPTFALSCCMLGSLSCSTTQGAVNKGTEATAKVVLPPSEETKLGRQLSAEIEKELTIHQDPEVQDYIKGLGTRIASSVQAMGRVPSGISFTFKVVDDPNTVNAFAMPGGYIYIYSGLLLKAESESEVIGVLGHEVAHVSERHVAERMVAAYGLQTLSGIALGKDPGTLAQIVTSLATQGYLLKYGRDQEREADEVGLSYVLRGQYSPIGMVSFFEKLAQSGPRPPTFLSSHPDPADRADRLRKMIKERGDVPERTGREEFQAMMPKFR